MKKIKYVMLIALVIPIATIILCYALGYVLFEMPCNPVRITKFDVGNKRSISIYEECGWREISAGIYYDIHEAGNVVVPMKLIEFYELDSIDQFDFEVAYAEDQSLVGVYDRAGLFSEVIMVDFKTGKAWPPGFIETYNYNEKSNLLERLRNENPELFPTPTPRPTPVLPTATNTMEPTPTSTLVVQATYTSQP